jgi:ferredoxin
MLDFTKCSLCGSCVEACRDGAIRFSREYNLASTNKDDYIMDLFKRLEDERIAAEGVAQASPPASAPGVPLGVPSPVTPPAPPQTEAPKAEQPKPASPVQSN